MPISWNTPNMRLSLAMARSPVHFDFHRRLAVRRGRENLALAGRNGGVAFDQLREHATQGLNTQRERRYVQQQDVLNFAAQHATLNGCAHRDHLVRVYTSVGFLAEQIADNLL